MFNDLVSNTEELFNTRMVSAQEHLRSLNLPTREEWQAEVTSQLNRILGLGNRVSPVTPLTKETPGTPEVVQKNLLLLSNESRAIINQLAALESDSARLLNLFAAAQNALRQQIRERVYSATSSSRREEFLNSGSLLTVEADLDFNAGLASCPVISNNRITPERIWVGVESEGKELSGLSALTDGAMETRFVWAGAQVELVFDFAKPQIINRIRLDLDDYQGLTLTSLTSSPDGSLREEVLDDLAPAIRQWDGASGKYSGDVILDFPPRHVKQIRMVIADRVGSREIALRGVEFNQRKFAAQGKIETKKLDSPAGNCWFSCEQQVSESLTSVTHQISFDGVHYSVIFPESQVNITGPFWYRALLERSDAAFEQQSLPLRVSGQDPTLSSGFVLRSLSTTDLGGGVIERNLSFDSVTSDIELKESPLPGTFAVWIGAAMAPASAYTITGKTIHFNSPQSGVQLRYQTSALTTAGLSARKEYHSPLLYRAAFERA